MAQKVLLYDPERCTGCRACEMACAYRNFRTLTPTKTNISIFLDENSFSLEAIHCLHCQEPVCMAACPAEAITKDDATGWVTINPLKCIGCRSCTYACPLAACWFDEEVKVAFKCNFCDGDPNCAKFCSPQAIRVVTREEAMKFAREEYLTGGKKWESKR
ncbi:MAG: 4Fe-4S dicluster domain-containing protein [Candidatus Hadarchaeales archaeon]